MRAAKTTMNDRARDMPLGADDTEAGVEEMVRRRVLRAVLR